MTLPDITWMLDQAQKVVTFGIAAWLYLEKKRDTTHARIQHVADGAEARLDDHARRIATLEARTGPTHDDIGDIHDKVNSIAVNQGQIKGEIKGMSDTLRLILNRIAEKGMK